MSPVPDRNVTAPSVSVVIPTWQRHAEVVRAIRSALDQTQPPFEVVVVNDGPDAEKGRIVAALGDSRIVYLEAPRRGRPSPTRNHGIRAARGDWIALLDDDDIWRPGKLEAQFAALERAGLPEAILAAREQIIVDGRLALTRPAHHVPPGTPIDEILFLHGGVHTSTLLAPRWLFLAQPLDETLERHEDWNWLLVAGQDLPTVVDHTISCDRHAAPGQGVSRPGGFDFSRAWYETNRKWLGPKSRAAFVSGVLGRKAAYDRRLDAIPWLFGELFASGSVRPSHVLRLLRSWIIPTRVRRLIKRGVSRT
jgi:glycosyltransferase involved in cell wall biosynthesis